MNFGKAGDTCNCSWGCFSSFQSPIHFLVLPSRLWLEMILQRQKLNFSEVMSEMCIQGWWKQMLESGFVGWGVSSSLNCFLEAGVSWRAAGVLWGHLPLSLMPFLSSPNCDLRSPRHMCTSLEQGYSYHCLQEVCSAFSSVFSYSLLGIPFTMWQL